MQLETMEVNERVVSPLKNLKELYNKIDSLVYWPGIFDLCKSTDYVYQGNDIDAYIDNPKRLQRNNVPKTIVCHDLKGGYLEDKYIDGSNEYNSYHFYHWNIVDTFIYFSHYFVTIPPFGWINAAHRHGVKILGTLITESAQGKEIWDEIFKSRNSVVKFADALIKIAQFYKFEGWLLNIENEINENNITQLVFFVQYLTENIHKKIDNSEIIWYDSVINTGRLSWQNELNEKNECFFNSCDGIFLNYTWTDSGLIESVIRANKQNRIKDIYVGLDVWGRGCPGGGGFNSAHALQRIREQGLSVAIFAPAWTYEYFGPKTFPRVENVFWAQLMQYLYIHVCTYDNERFITTFCRGAGKKYYEYGKQITYKDPTTNNVIERNSSFYNMAMQKHQVILTCPHLKFISMNILPPARRNDQSKKLETQKCTYETLHEKIKVLDNEIIFEDKADSFAGINCTQFTYDISYEGGGCIKLLSKNIRSYHRLFFVHVKFSKDIQARIIYRYYDEESSESNVQNSPVLLLRNNVGVKSFVPTETVQYGLEWKMSIFQTNVKFTHEIGVALTRIGSCYIGKIVLEPTTSRLT
ncbi:PREDICTED: cytosolic endo-beta-N-acetylglucosaminidase [Ceratosolen solmsi marchali]|uniref:Cytosolic endo-beta-N-acetylglucosaminidase n=1 Tax=Ceratosolen solmsi marchali TaxID=326594 RepID=A0AAJ7DVT7_9HYME|nr:PREDICTED: cytosolic endo-beta-N-acetylglucosaminidase [Ceratosolen solmsi marchali]